MLPIYLKLKNFRSYIDETIRFDEFGHLFCLCAPNGYGKSSIIEAITTALFWQNNSTASNGSGMDALIHHDAIFFEIQFCFQMNGSEYLIVTRKRRDRTRELEFYIDGIPQTDKVTDTQEKINSVIKMNYDTFLDTICVGQGQSSRFMVKKPAERKETLAQILDITKFEEYERVAKEQKKAIKEHITEVEAKISFIDEQEYNIFAERETAMNLTQENALAQEKIDKLTTELDDVLKRKADYETRIVQRNMLLRARKQAQERVEKMQTQYDNAQEQLAAIEISDIDYDSMIQELQSKLSEIRNVITKLREEISSLKAHRSNYENQIAELQAKIERFVKYDKGVCDFCGNVITAEHKKSHIDAMQSQINDIQNKINTLDEQCKELNEQGKATSLDGKKISDECASLENERRSTDKKKEQYKALNERIAEYKRDLEDAKKELEENLANEIAEVEDESFNDGELKRDINTLSQTVSANKSKIAVCNERINNAEQNEAKLKALNDELHKLKDEYSDYNAVATAFGKTGIPAYIMESDLPDIELETNKILSLLTDNSMNVEFITTKPTAKGKKTTDTLDIVVKDINGSRSYETFSGGEKFRIDFACHIGMAKFLTKRSGATIDFLIIDEGFGSQDEMAQSKFVDSITILQKIFKQIMVITHIKDLQNSFQNRIMLTKDAMNGSKIEFLR